MLRRAFRLGVRAGKVGVRAEFPMLEMDNTRKGFFESEQYRAVLAHLPEYLKPRTGGCVALRCDEAYRASHGGDLQAIRDHGLGDAPRGRREARDPPRSEAESNAITRPMIGRNNDGSRGLSDT